MKKLLIILSIVLASKVDARYVNGTVYDEVGDGVPGITILLKGTNLGTTTDINGFYTIEVHGESEVLVFSGIGFDTQEVQVGTQKLIDVTLTTSINELQEIVVIGAPVEFEEHNVSSTAVLQGQASGVQVRGGAFKKIRRNASYAPSMDYDDAYHNTEEYASIEENGFKKVTDKPLSTFSIDVDAASYSNVRRFLNNGQMPPKDAVRIEEMINYFGYEYKNPTGENPFSINTEVSKAPWNENHLVAQVGLQGEKIGMDNLPASNIVFLIDVSGSMSAPNKLPLLKSAFKLLANELRPQDKVSIVVYAGAAGLVLPATDGNDKKKMMEALENLQAGGSTAGGAGIQLAYRVAKENFVEGGNNRVVLATDGDFNVGASSNAEMERLIEEKRKDGVFLTVLGFGMGNYKDSKMEKIADKGNGNYAYIDNMREAKKVLVNEFGGTLFTIAKDVKIQVEFNPSVVQAYRLIGYENRKLNDEDFNDDTKDAGELGSGHTVTALYEIIPVGVKSEFVKDIDPLKYQGQKSPHDVDTQELLTVKFRYKEPDGKKSKLITEVVKNQVRRSGNNLNWAMAVTGFGMMLRDSEYKGNLSYDWILETAKSSKGEDAFGYRQEFIGLVDIAKRMNPKNQ